MRCRLAPPWVTWRCADGPRDMPRCAGILDQWLAGGGGSHSAGIPGFGSIGRWTNTPMAVLSAEDVDPVAAIVASWPDNALVTDLPIAEHWHGAGRLRRKVSVQDFAARARAARRHRHSWTLSSTMTDLCVDKNGEVAHAPFDPAGPGTVKWLHHRLVKVHAQVTPSIERIGDSLAGRAVRVKDNGLGFDQTRLGSQADATSPWIDPGGSRCLHFSALPCCRYGAAESTGS